MTLGLALLLVALLLHLRAEGGWNFTTGTYVVGLVALVPVALLEARTRRPLQLWAAALSGGIVFLTAGYPSLFDYVRYQSFDLLAHFSSGLSLTLLLWAGAYSVLLVVGIPHPERVGALWIAPVVVLAIGALFEALEYLTDAAFAWSNYKGALDALADFVADGMGVILGTVLVARLRPALLAP